MIKFSDYSKHVYTYDATGKKLRAEYHTPIMVVTEPQVPDMEEEEQEFAEEEQTEWEYEQEWGEEWEMEEEELIPEEESEENGEVVEEPMVPEEDNNCKPWIFYDDDDEIPVWNDYFEVPCEVTTVDYFGDFIYVNNVLKRVLFPGGYVTFRNDSIEHPEYHFYLTDHQGNIRVVANQNGEVEQVNHYYPYGGLMGESSNSDHQPYKYNGKELDRHHGLDWYDYGARWYNDISWMTPDPLAEKYYEVSPYMYCYGNPVKYIDPDGREFTESSWEYVNMLLNNISKRINNNANKIADIQAKIDGGGLSEKKVKTLQNRIKRIEANSAELKSVQEEIDVLKQSSQVYDIALDNSRNNSNMLGTEVNSIAYFNPENGVFEIRLGDSSLGLMAHELKHAYQFEIGAFSTGTNHTGTPFYDQSDEWEAYKRGELFGGERVLTLPTIYSGIQTGPVDYKSLNPMIISNLHSFAKRTKSAFRINGVTYNGIPKK